MLKCPQLPNSRKNATYDIPANIYGLHLREVHAARRHCDLEKARAAQVSPI